MLRIESEGGVERSSGALEKVLSVVRKVAKSNTTVSRNDLAENKYATDPRVKIINQVAKMHYRSKGSVRLPIVIRVPFGGGPATKLTGTAGSKP